MRRVCRLLEVRRLYWKQSIVPNLYVALPLFKFIPPNQMLDWNTLLQSRSMGSRCVFNVAPSEWGHLPKPLLATANARKVPKAKGQRLPGWC
jgi:hypothetical protein